MKEKLQKILKKMENEIDCYDTEMAHARADDFLIELIKVLSHNLNNNLKGEVEAIVDCYDKIDKWFA